MDWVLDWRPPARERPQIPFQLVTRAALLCAMLFVGLCITSVFCVLLCVVCCVTRAAALAVTLSDLGVGTTLWGGVRSIYSSWGMSKCDHCGTEFTHIYTALRSTWSDSVTIFTVGCKSWYAISHPPKYLTPPPPALLAKTNQSFQTLSHTLFTNIFYI